MAAQRIQALLAPKRPDGRCDRGPSMRSANTVSITACWRWVMSASAVGGSVLVRNGWCRHTGNSAWRWLASLTRRTTRRAVIASGVPAKAV